MEISHHHKKDLYLDLTKKFGNDIIAPAAKILAKGKRNYSFKEARQLISEYNELLRQLEGCKIKVMGYKSRIGNDSLYLLQNFYFQNTELTDLKYGKASESNYYEIEDLIQDIYYYLESDSILARSSRIYNLYGQKLQKIDDAPQKSIIITPQGKVFKK